nr:hypothetical protein [uncultured bacterium]
MASETAETLKKALNKKRKDGNFQYSDEELRYFLVYVLLTSGTDLTKASKEVHQMVGQVAEKAGVKVSDTPEQMKATLQAYFAKNPVNAELQKNVETDLRELLQKGGVKALGRELEKFKGEKRAGVLGGDGARPEGAVGAGPMARFQVKIPPKK